MENSKKKKSNNMEFLKLMLDIDKQMEEEENQNFLTDKCREFIEDVLKKGEGNPILTNHYLNSMLKPSPAIKLK